MELLVSFYKNVAWIPRICVNAKHWTSEYETTTLRDPVGVAVRDVVACVLCEAVGGIRDAVGE